MTLVETQEILTRLHNAFNVVQNNEKGVNTYYFTVFKHVDVEDGRKAADLMIDELQTISRNDNIIGLLKRYISKVASTQTKGVELDHMGRPRIYWFDKDDKGKKKYLLYFDQETKEKQRDIVYKTRVTICKIKKVPSHYIYSQEEINQYLDKEIAEFLPKYDYKEKLNYIGWVNKIPDYFLKDEYFEESKKKLNQSVKFGTAEAF